MMEWGIVDWLVNVHRALLRMEQVDILNAQTQHKATKGHVMKFLSASSNERPHRRQTHEVVQHNRVNFTDISSASDSFFEISRVCDAIDDRGRRTTRDRNVGQVRGAEKLAMAICTRCCVADRVAKCVNIESPSSAQRSRLNIRNQ